MIVPWLTSLDGTIRQPLFSFGPYGSWGDLETIFRWGEGACGLYEASWTMPLPADYEHPLLRRGSLVEIMDGPWRIGSPLVLTEPSKGTGIANPWRVTATGMGREVEGQNSFYATDGSGNATMTPTVAADQAIVDGWRIAGRDGSVPATSPSTLASSEGLNTVAAVLGAGAQVAGKRWLVKNDNLLYFVADPTTPSYQVTPDAAALGVADDDYASTVKVRYLDSTTLTYLTRTATNSAAAAAFGVRQFPVDITDRAAMSAAAAQNIADQVLALTKGRLGWTNGLTLSSNQLLTMGGGPAALSKVAEDVGNGCMVRLNGIWSPLLESNGQTYLDIIIGEAPYVDGAPTIQLNPLGLAPRDLASIIESVAGAAAA